jgi:(E)-2-((N-methylformamido)methylene)succinate hydrolase
MTRPVVLIHGVGLDHTMWFPVMSMLRHRRTIAYDMVGHGNAVRPAGPYTLDVFVDQLGAVVDAVGGDVELVGFSMGALVAQGLALSPSGGQVRRMVLLNGVYNRTATERAAVLGRVADVRSGGYMASIEPALDRWFTSTADSTVVEGVRRRLLANDVDSYAAAYEVFATADGDIARRVTEISTPTLVATGADDQRSTPAMARALAAALPSGQVRMLPALRHLTPLEAPQLVAAMIDEFCTTTG